MKVLFDINHPAHVHFFKNPAKLLCEQGHEVVFTSREKDITIQLLDELGLQHQVLSSLGGKGLLSLGVELISRDLALYKVVKQFNPDILAAIGGTFVAHVGFFCRIPSLVFYDTENAKLQNLITYPLASCVLTPSCYHAWLPKHHRRYQGYHELSYLHPDYFCADRTVAIKNGLRKNQDNFFIRLVSWQANHDVGEAGWSEALLRKVIKKMSSLGNIMISTEVELGEEFKPYIYHGAATDVHHVMAFCRAFIGESATMASESAVLGVPAIYAANTGRGYTDEQEERFGLVKNIRDLQWSQLEPAIDAVLQLSATDYSDLHQRLLDETIDVASYVASSIISYPQQVIL